MNNGHKVPQLMQDHFRQISELTDAYCAKFLDTEYAELAKSVLAALCRKRPSPVVSGKKQVWACSVIYVLGQANFLFDSSQIPHVTHSHICDWFTVSKSTAGSKAKLIRDTLNINMFNHNWKLRSKMEDSSFVWMIEVDGLVVDVRHMPVELQQQAFNQGLIPYVPALGK